MDLDDADFLAAFDVATVTAAIDSQLPPSRQRGLWLAVARRALPGPDQFQDTDQILNVQLGEAEQYVLSEHPQRLARWDRPSFRVRRSLVQALFRHGDAPALLSAALDQAAELPDESGPRGYDAAMLVISGATLGLDEELRSRTSGQRQALASKLYGQAERSSDLEVIELSGFVAEQLRSTAGQLEDVELPRLLQTGPAPTYRLIRPAGIQPVESAIASSDPRPVLPLLNRSAPAWRTLAHDQAGDLLDLIASPWSLAFTDFSPPETAADPEQPQPEPDELNVGLVRADRPEHPIIRGLVKGGTDHLVWVSIGPPDADAVPGPHTPLDLEDVQDADVLTVVVFPDQALTVPSAPYQGSFIMSPERPLPVLRSAEQPTVADERLSTRVYFAVRTPDLPGSYDVRVLVYHRNTLLQVRQLTLPVGRRETGVSVRTPYTLVRSPTASAVRDLAPRRLCLYANESDTGSHQLCFSASDGTELKHARLTLQPQEVAGLFAPVRRGLRIVSWDSPDAWDEKPEHEYRYQRQADRRFATDFTQLEQDMCRLAKAGYATWSTLTLNYLAGDPEGQGHPVQQQEEWRRLMRPPGIVQVATAQGSKLIPPLAGLYDIGLDDELPLSELRLCPKAAELLRTGGDLATLECFQDGCRPEDDSKVCPSGFWGLRHEITVPTSLGQAAGAQPRTVVGPRTALVGTLPEEQLAGVTAHAGDVRNLFGLDKSEHVCTREDWFDAASRARPRYGVLYFLCHGEERLDTGSLVIVLDNPESGISESNLGDKHVLLDHHPLVMLNACETAALEPEKVTNLIQGFMTRGAGAVIGAEIMIFPSLAYEFGVTFMKAFVTEQASLGAAIRRARLSLLSQWNPLGLAYVGYGLPELSLVTAAAAQSAA